MNAVVSLSIAAVLFLLGRWGYTNSERLAPHLLSDESRHHRTRILRRGAVTCQVVAVLFVAIAVIGAL